MGKLYFSVLVFGWKVDNEKVFKYLNDNNLEMGCEVNFGGTTATLEWFGDHGRRWNYDMHSKTMDVCNDCMSCYICLSVESSMYGAQYTSIDLNEFDNFNSEVSDEIIQFAFDLGSTENDPTIHLTMDIHD
jgi:hypothetical protein